MWMVDLARELSPTRDHLERICRATLDGGYDALGLYLEHRFAWPSTPWAHGNNAIRPEDIAALRREFPTLTLIPFLNLLGHCEGFLYTEHGSRFAEERFKGLQASSACPEFVSLTHRLVDDALNAFDSDIIHLGGDETGQLGAGRSRPAEGEPDKAAIYANHFGPLLEKVRDAGRTPAIWGDMLLNHPEALEKIPKDTLIFDWQYFQSPVESARTLSRLGHRIVLCPAIQTYNAVWCHLEPSFRNLEQHIQAESELGSHGICITTWEFALFGNLNTALPIVAAMGKRLAGETVTAFETPEEREWARLMGEELAALGPPFGWSGIRSGFKCRFLLYGNPFLLWLRHRDELLGAIGEQAYRIAEQALSVAPNADMRGVAQFLKSGIEFVRLAEEARCAYAEGSVGGATAALAPMRQIFDHLAVVANASKLNAAGSTADVERCRIAKEHVERVIMRVKTYGDGSLGYLPSFEHVTHPQFTPHDQGAWWLINRWANE
jgi:hypothetical protein